MRMLLLAALMASPVSAGDLMCRREMFCSDARCFPADPSDEEGADYVSDATGPNPQLYVSEGTWVPATLVKGDGTMTWTATSPQGEAVFLAVRTKGAAYIFTRRDPGAEGRVWTATGRCENRP